MLVTYQRSGDGAVVMTNAQGGQRLANDILRSIASVYGWPDFHPMVRATVRVDPSILATYTGIYKLKPAFSMAIMLENGQLMAQATHQHKFPVFPESQSMFFFKAIDARIEFFSEENGQISHLVLHQNGNDMRGERKQ